MVFYVHQFSELSAFLRYVTGVGRIVPGLRITVRFVPNTGCIGAHTCANCLELPEGIDCIDTFISAMVAATMDTGQAFNSV